MWKESQSFSKILFYILPTGTLHKILGIQKFGQKGVVNHKIQDPHFRNVVTLLKLGILILAMHSQFK